MKKINALLSYFIVMVTLWSAMQSYINHPMVQYQLESNTVAPCLFCF